MVIYNTALYLRISREDGDKAESDSISNQRAFILDYIKSRPEIRVCSERIDDGYSGADFNRPAFNALLEDIKTGAVNCIIVKDLSRFGRNYIEAGRYIERIFPYLGVRFISINDHYDSACTGVSDEIIIPFKNLVNDAYCRDISVKIRSHLEVKRKRGDFVGSFAVYGYMKSEENKNKLVADPYASRIVKDIFKWKIEGMSQQRIADRLNEMGELSPLEYKRAMGLKFTTGFRQRAKAKWSAVAVGRILNNPVYTGVLVQGKRTTPNYKVKRRLEKPENTWVRVENAHEPVIPEDMFRTAGLLLKQDTRIAPERETVHIFSGMLFCADCCRVMTRKTVSAGGKKYFYYVCSTSKAGEGCTTHCISEAVLNQSVLAAIRSHITAMPDIERIVDFMNTLPLKQEEIIKRKAQVIRKQEEIEKYKNLKLSLYEDLKSSVINRNEYREYKSIYSRKCAEAEAAARKLKQDMALLPDNKDSGDLWVENFKDRRNIDSLSRKIMAVFIERINIFENSRIEIKFKYQDAFEFTKKGPVKDITELRGLPVENAAKGER